MHINYKRPSDVVHCLSVDVEGFAEGMVESFTVPDQYLDEAVADREIETNVAEVLAEFRRLNLHATFFVLGRIAERFPALIRGIAENGHELGSHSFYHKRIFNQTRRQFRQDLRRSKDSIESASGKRVRGFRAPDFSIRNDSRWILDEIKEAGFSYDSSLTPTDIHDVYGMPDIAPNIHRLENGLWEFPGSTFRFLGRTIPYGGGGYMRLYPICLSRYLIRQCGKNGLSAMLYMHPFELGSQIPKVEPISRYRRFRHYYHTSNGMLRMQRVLNGFRVGTAEQILIQHGMEED